jgi:hypothetical protein
MHEVSELAPALAVELGGLPAMMFGCVRYQSGKRRTRWRVDSFWMLFQTGCGQKICSRSRKEQRYNVDHQDIGLFIYVSGRWGGAVA